jgi:hypothetical protein
MRRWPLLALIGLLATPALAWAQADPRTLPPVVLDLRGFSAGLGQDPVTAAQLGLLASDLPGRGFGGVAALQLYPLRRPGFSVGIGGEWLIVRARRTRDGEDAVVMGPPIAQRLEGLAAALSLNFGDRDGWSYLSAGMGPMRFSSYVGETAPPEPAPKKSTINLGGGARWFTNSHLAVTFDLRFYLTRPEDPTASYPGRQRNRLLVLSGGISIK